MPHRTTKKQALTVLDTLGNMQRYLHQLKLRVRDQTPGHSLCGWIDRAQDAINGARIHFEHWATNSEAGTPGKALQEWEE